MSIESQVIDALTRVVGPDWIKTHGSDLDTYAADGLPTRESKPGAVVLPKCTAEIRSILRILNHHRVPFVARGAGTGLSGGALAGSDAVSVVLTRMNKILEIDAQNRRAVVEPGVVNIRLSEAAAQFGLHYAPDPSSQSACTIGGNVAENAGGPHCLKYGVTTNHILELDVVLPNGEITTLGSPGGDTWGPDLVGLFIGSEGMFGIATRIVVRLTPIPTDVRTLLADFDSLRQAGTAVSKVIASGIVPAALEMMDRECVNAVEASIYAAGYPTDAAAVLLAEVDGSGVKSVEAEADSIEKILLENGARTVRTAANEAERNKLWQGRKKAFGALGRISPHLLVQDAVVPRSKLPDVLERISDIGKWHGVKVSSVSHAGDGNLHPNLNFDRNNAEEYARVEAASAEIIDACIKAGGTITGEHGVGMDKIQHMTKIFDADTLTAMREARRVFDPNEIANPGKVLPTHSCREWSGAPGLTRSKESQA
ncbi:MAG: FAD-binding protein [Gemmatimonadota bacterium]|nr:FAD-binding protein [Gemmatimonadota bacterium]